MADWLIHYGSWCLAPFGLLGMYVVGLKKRWGWVLSMTTQALWAFYAVGTGQYGFLIGTCSYFAVYLKNWLGWGRPVTDPDQTALVALRRIFQDMDSTGRAGDEWAYEWMHEVWPALVSRELRAAVGDREAEEEIA